MRAKSEIYSAISSSEMFAHRLSTLNKMDRIVLGSIIEEGTHEELLSINGHYAHMWNMQVGGFLPESAEI